MQNAKLILVFFALLAACALFKWPGYLVNDNAGDDLKDAFAGPMDKINEWTGKEPKEELPVENIPPPPQISANQGAQALGTAYPMDMSILNNQGQLLEIQLLGRGANHIQFIRQSDQLMFELSFDQLATSTQDKLRNFPITIAGGMTPVTAAPASRSSNAKKSIQDEIERNKSRIAELTKRSKSASSSQKSAISKDIKRLKEDNKKLSKRMSEL